MLSMLQFPTPQGHHAVAVVRAYQKDFGRNPTWQELYYWTNMIRANPSSRAWVTQLSRTQNGTVPYSTSTLGTYGATHQQHSTKSEPWLLRTEAGPRRQNHRDHQDRRQDHRSDNGSLAREDQGRPGALWRRCAAWAVGQGEATPESGVADCPSVGPRCPRHLPVTDGPPACPGGSSPPFRAKPKLDISIVCT